MASTSKNLLVAVDDRQNRRAEIIETSSKVFLEKGFFGTSMSDLASACGIKKPSFYHHFSSKDDLFIRCVIEGYAPAVDRIKALRDETDRPARECLIHALNVLYDITFGSDVGRMSPLIAEVSRSIPDLSKRFFDEYIAVQRQTLRDIVERGVAEGTLRRPDYDVLYHLVFGPLVTLSLSLEMFVGLDDLDAAFPVDRLRTGHIDTVMDHLRVA